VRAALLAEWTKVRSAPGTVGLLFGVVALTAGVSVMASATVACPESVCSLDPAKVSLTGVAAGQAVVAVLAVLAMGGEYASGMVRVSLAAVPRRPVLLAAKACVLTAVVGVASVVAVLGSVLAGHYLLPTRMSLVDGGVLRAAGGSVLYLMLIALLSLGAVTAVREQATAIGLVLALLYVYPIVTVTVSDADLRRHLEQLGPMNAGLAIQATTHLKDLPIGPWPGLGVLAAWAAGMLLLGGLVLQRRDA
jgi:ABC-2 type transport system permease protein